MFIDINNTYYLTIPYLPVNLEKANNNHTTESTYIITEEAVFSLVMDGIRLKL